MTFINLNEVVRAADALINAYGIEEAVEKARLIETDTALPLFASAVRDELEQRLARERLCSSG